MDFYQEKYKYLTSVCLNLTDDCNLRCKYCFVNHQPHYMSLQTAKDSADWLANNLSIKKDKGWVVKNTKAHITFFGGEPMLLYDEIIIPLVEYIEKKYSDLFTFGMTTNGTLLNLERIQWLYKHNFSLLFSIDGNKTTQDINRPCANQQDSSFDKLLQVIPYLLIYYPNITFRATIDEDTAKNTFENYLFAEKAGFKNIFMIPNARSQWKQENINLLDIEIQKIFAYRKNQQLFGETSINASFINDILQKVENNNIFRCGLGTSSGSIGYNGDIYGCQEQDSYDNKSIFYIGNIYNGGINIDLHKRLLTAYEQSEQNKCEDIGLCDKCLLQNNCQQSYCPSLSYDLFQKFNIVPKIHCIWYNMLYKNMMLLK